ncbi:FAD-linked oxidase C-terminal domain-containing protein [Xinfangfangia sp. CPCC 101601]|uniref:FAD-linked oxidase C-terminal domain-containing protein n=1 Tax=Pseudogemmobacter lacusdianii TaxID=3069608 RepID=A0ABU0VXF8_9RHOB|nr:FAD-binding and (Fe-S)-binding domain-containing protein [Xinfangfangia sp. CPCC 101601]MDQ2065875.1 FAD-linked oxidase C-terminal domain-containing protein [Xinfangfangia sp. CPCC 101601]
MSAELRAAPPAYSASIQRQGEALARRLQPQMQGEVTAAAFDRGRYATDASIYQIMPLAVAFPKDATDLQAALSVAQKTGVPVIARGGGTSQNGQPLGAGLVLDFSRYFNGLLELDTGSRQVVVQPGMVLERLNTRLRAEGLFFPVEPSTASRCTLGGMAGNNSCGARSLAYGKMVDNVRAVEGLMASGEAVRFVLQSPAHPALSRAQALAEVERAEIEARFPKVQRRVGGYNLDALLAQTPNPAHLMVGSEGTLALTTALTLQLAPLPARRVMGVCHFPSFRAAMEATRHIVALGPTAVELVDNNVLTLGAEIALFQRTLSKITKGHPDCLLLVEFAGESEGALAQELKRLDQCMSDHGYSGAVVEITEAAAQREVWEMREACLNIMMSATGDAKPVSFIEDCAVPLEHLADYTDEITELFARHNTRGTWYAHASEGCLHVRPILNLKDPRGLAAMRAIAEEACALVRRFKGSHSGEHGDGISRSEFHRMMFGDRIVAAFEGVKDAFDPKGLLNPGKIVRPYRMDDPALMRFAPGYHVAEPVQQALDWSDKGGFGGAIEMCNNNGTCRKLAGGVMCPSYRVTGQEQHLTRGRANALRLAISGQLGEGALTSTAMKESMALCVGCKGCRQECPTGVDMAKMKIEVLHHYHARHGLPLRERLVAYLPRYAPFVARLRGLANLRDRVPGLAWLSERLLGLAADRPLPVWAKPWAEGGRVSTPEDVQGDGRDLVLFGDTFNRYFEPENLTAATRVLSAAGYRLHRVPVQGRPLCCGRSFMASGQTTEARKELQRSRDALLPYVQRGARVVGLEPSCLLTFRDEALSLLPGDESQRLAEATQLIEEALAQDLRAGLVALDLDALPKVAHLHGHCHQKALGAMGAVEQVLRAVPELRVETIPSSCCGMAGAFGHQAETLEFSRAMGELSLLPAVRAAGAEDWIIADGTSCRAQIKDGSGRQGRHVVRLLEACLKGPA